MLSPTSTPFNGLEVAGALGLTPLGYRRAVSCGALERSVHFCERVSLATALHSLVDVVRFSVFRGLGWPYSDWRQHTDQIDSCLDAVCWLVESSEDLTLPGNADELSEHLLGAIYPYDHDELFWLAPAVAKSWLCSHWRLVDILLADGSGTSHNREAPSSTRFAPPTSGFPVGKPSGISRAPSTARNRRKIWA